MFINLAMAVACVLLFHAVWRDRIGQGAMTGSVAFALTPVFFSESVQFMDYMPATLLLLWSLHEIGKDRPSRSGFAMGLSIASRLSYSPFMIPLVASAKRGVDRRAVLSLVGLAGLVALISYGFPVSQFGMRLLEPVSLGGDEFARVMFRGTVRVWGAIGSLFLLGFLAVYGRKTSGWAWCGPIALVVGYLQYMRFPYDYGYLLPCLPFVLLWAGVTLPRRMFLALCAGLAIGPFLSVSKDKQLEGTAFSDLAVARERAAVSETVRLQLLAQPNAAAIVADLAPQVEFELGVKRPFNVIAKSKSEGGSRQVWSSISREELHALQTSGRRFFTTEYSLQTVNRVCGFDVRSQGVAVLPTPAPLNR